MRNMRHGTIAGLLAVVAVLLALNLAVNLPGQEAQAGSDDDDSSGDGRGRGRPVEAVAFEVAGGGGPGGLEIWRIFSDGTVERNLGLFVGGKDCEQDVVEWCGWQVVPE